MNTIKKFNKIQQIDQQYYEWHFNIRSIDQILLYSYINCKQYFPSPNIPKLIMPYQFFRNNIGAYFDFHLFPPSNFY